MYYWGFLRDDIMKKKTFLRIKENDEFGDMPYDVDNRGEPQSEPDRQALKYSRMQTAYTAKKIGADGRGNILYRVTDPNGIEFNVTDGVKGIVIGDEDQVENEDQIKAAIYQSKYAKQMENKMKVTKNYLRQIIKEELQKEGFSDVVDKVKGFFGGKNKNSQMSKEQFARKQLDGLLEANPNKLARDLIAQVSKAVEQKYGYPLSAWTDSSLKKAFDYIITPDEARAYAHEDEYVDQAPKQSYTRERPKEQEPWWKDPVFDDRRRDAERRELEKQHRDMMNKGNYGGDDIQHYVRENKKSK